MNFLDETVKCSNFCASWCPAKSFIAIAFKFKLSIYEATSKKFDIFKIFNTTDEIQYIEWSKDGSLILTCSYDKNVIQIFSILQPDWSCRIDEGVSGLKRANFSPDCTHILSVADFSLKITIWSLVSKSVICLKHVKNISKCFDFSSDCEYMALVERQECRDSIKIFTCSHWEPLRQFECKTRDLQGIKWSPDDGVIAVWDSVLDYLIVFYSPDGRLLGEYSAYDLSLGIKCVEWSPSSQFIAVGSYDGQVRILNHITWSPTLTFKHSNFLENIQCDIFSEINIGNAKASYYVSVDQRPVNIPSIKLDPKKAEITHGVGFVSFSKRGDYLATKNDNMPNTVWIWSIRTCKLKCVLNHLTKVKTFSWQNSDNVCLSICLMNNQIYFWTPAGCITSPIPLSPVYNYKIFDSLWNFNGTMLALISKENVAFMKMNEVKSDKKKQK